MAVTMNAMHFNRVLSNAVQYSQGFLDGVGLKTIEFNHELAIFTSNALKKYIDSQARMNPRRLHHVYEWAKAGNQESRLFDFDTTVSKNNIVFTGNFLPSTSVSSGSKEPFTDKANVMENDIQVVIEPKNSNVLVFEDEGQTVFTTRKIYIDHPGGNEVAGSFGETVNDFFNNYFTNALLRPLLNKFSTANEFTANFAYGTKIGRNVGVRAGKQYLSLAGGVE
jgi:hypothetical protein